MPKLCGQCISVNNKLNFHFRESLSFPSLRLEPQEAEVT